MSDQNSPSSEVVLAVCQAIATHEPFTADELRDVYFEVKSFDELFDIIVIAKRDKCSLSAAVKPILTVKSSKGKGKTAPEVRLSFDIGPIK